MTKGPVSGALVSACYKEVEHVGCLSIDEKLHCLGGCGKEDYGK